MTLSILEPVLSDYTKGSVAWVLQRVIEDIDSLAATTDLKPLGPSQRYIMRKIQRLPIGKLQASALEDSDIVEFCKGLRVKIKAATVMQYVTYLNGAFKYARSSWKECKSIAILSIKDAFPQLKRQKLVGKSIPRKRVPVGDEMERILAWLEEYSKKPRVKMKIVPAILFGLASSRRCGEVCRITHGDIDWDHKDDDGNPAPMYTVRDLKHPTMKKGNDKTFPLLDPLPQLIRMQARLTDKPEERVFPYNAHSVSALYVKCKKQLGIQGLRLHDNRRAAITTWLKKLTPHQVKTFISGHETTMQIDRTYDATNPDGGHALVRSKEVRPAA